MAKRAPPSHRIGREGRALFETLLPTGWICRREDGNDDYGIDVVVEIVDGEELTGLRCLVQLRSTEKAKVRANSVVIQVGVDEVLYWNSKQLATFVVVVDVVNKEAYWIEVHQWFRAYIEANGDDWQKQGSVVVSIPRANTSSTIDEKWPPIVKLEPAMISVGQLGMLP